MSLNVCGRTLETHNSSLISYLLDQYFAVTVMLYVRPARGEVFVDLVIGVENIFYPKTD